MNFVHCSAADFMMYCLALYPGTLDNVLPKSICYSVKVTLTNQDELLFTVLSFVQ